MARTIAKTLAQMDAVDQTAKRDAPKEFVIERRPDGLYWIRFTAGGEVPNLLKGMWTSTVRAEAAIANHLLDKVEVGSG